MPSRPVIETVGDIYRYDFQEEKIKAQIARLRDTSDGLKGELQLVTYRENEESFIHYANINLLSTRSRKEISRYAGSRVNTVDWDAILECICSWSVQYYREGEPIQKVGSTIDNTPVHYALYPLIIEEEPNILYGYGGSGKSYIACLCGLLIQTGESKLGLKPRGKSNVLYLDYEASSKELNKRLFELKNGLTLPPETELHYRRCYQPLADDIEAMKSIILDNNIGVVVIDSIGPACGGEPETADVAIRYFRAVRSLGVTSLSISHKTKKEDAKGPFGSVYWQNLARYIWQAELGDLPQNDRFPVTLRHEKSNMTGLFNPIALEFTFYSDAKAVLPNRVDISDMPSPLENLSVRDKIKRALGRGGEMTEGEIVNAIPCDKTGEKPKIGTIHSTCYKEKGLFEKVGNRWRLRAINE